MTNSKHKHKWKFVKNVYFGMLYAGNLRIRGVYRCNCGKLKYGKRSGPSVEQILEDEFYGN